MFSLGFVSFHKNIIYTNSDCLLEQFSCFDTILFMKDMPESKEIHELDALKIGALVHLTGLSERTLRYYEELGIITPARSEGGTRYYSSSDIKIAKVTHKLRELDISLEVIKTIATKRREFYKGEHSSKAMIEILENLSSELDDRITKIHALKSELKDTLRLVRSCTSCQNVPSPTGCPTCPLETEIDLPPIVSLIWQKD